MRHKNNKKEEKKKFWNRKKTMIFLISFLVISVIFWFLYSWYFQVLPQATIYLMDDIKTPKSGDKILVFSPHPDDETIACGGYIANSIKNGASVWIVLVTDGNKHHLKDKRYSEFIDATGVLGVPERNLFFLNYPDGRLNKEDSDKIKPQFREIIDEVKPQIVLAPHSHDDHPDHVTTGKIATSLFSKKDITLYQYLVHYPRFPLPKRFEPQFYLLPPVRMFRYTKVWEHFMLPQDIDDQKLEAILKYKTQLKYIFPRELILSMMRRNELFALPSDGE